MMKIKSDKKSNLFSLIELLIVMSILVVLFSLTMPSLKSAFKASNKITCQQQMRRIGVAVNLYSDDYNGMITPHYNPYWLNALLGLTGYSYLEQPDYQSMKTSYMCPEYRLDDPTLYWPCYDYDEFGTTNGQVYSSYTYNSSVGNVPFPKYFKHMPDPSEQLLMVDGIHREPQNTIWYATTTISASEHYDLGVHNSESNYLHIDLSVRSYELHYAAIDINPTLANRIWRWNNYPQ